MIKLILTGLIMVGLGLNSATVTNAEMVSDKFEATVQEVHGTEAKSIWGVGDKIRLIVKNDNIILDSQESMYADAIFEMDEKTKLFQAMQDDGVMDGVWNKVNDRSIVSVYPSPEGAVPSFHFHKRGLSINVAIDNKNNVLSKFSVHGKTDVPGSKSIFCENVLVTRIE